jgi:nitrite reductase (NADH) small subunit
MTTATAPRTTPITYNLGPLANIPLGEGRMAQVGASVIAVFRTRAGEVYATQAWCPHRGGPLADGIVGAGKVICPLHSFKFDLATGQPIGGDCDALRTYPVTVNAAGDVLLTFTE